MADERKRRESISKDIRIKIVIKNQGLLDWFLLAGSLLTVFDIELIGAFIINGSLLAVYSEGAGVCNICKILYCIFLSSKRRA